MSKLKHGEGTKFLECIGGAEKLEEVKAYIDTLKLSECPFCGGEAEVYIGGEMFYYPRVLIRCGSCRNGTMTTVAAYDMVRQKDVTIYDALETVTKLWNRRIDTKENRYDNRKAV